MELIELYYYSLGEEPNDLEREITNKTFDFLKDNGFKDSEIIKLLPCLPAKMDLTPADLPDFLWENSLLKRNIFYYHNELHITSPAPYWDFEKDTIVSPKFYLEMKINYQVDDLINYYYRHFNMDTKLIDNKKDKGSMEYLLNKYKNLGFIEAVDFILYLIDQAVNEEVDSVEIIDLKRFEKDTFEYLKNKTMNAAVEKNNVIIWR